MRSGYDLALAFLGRQVRMCGLLNDFESNLLCYNSIALCVTVRRERKVAAIYDVDIFGWSVGFLDGRLVVHSLIIGQDNVCTLKISRNVLTGATC